MNTQEHVSRRAFVRRLGLLGAAGLGSSTLLAACGGGSSESSAPGSGAATASGDAQQVTITPLGNEMKYETTEFTVQPGQEVRLVFDNTATAPSMQHNVVVLTTNDAAAVQRVGETGMQAGAKNDYVPEGDDAILAYTPIAMPGETVEVTFTAPEETGDYTYVCTFPGHWATMQGTMHVGGSAA